MQSLHVLGIPTFVFFQYMHADQVGQNFNLHPNFKLWKRRHYLWNIQQHTTHPVCLNHARTLNTWKTIVTDTDSSLRIRIQKIDIRAPLLVPHFRKLLGLIVYS